MTEPAIEADMAEQTSDTEELSCEDLATYLQALSEKFYRRGIS
jgi:hypothetical protein